MTLVTPVKERFFEHVLVGANDCWEWGAYRNADGYGKFFMGSYRDGTAKCINAHRASWELHCGPIPAKMYVLHRCDNRSCVNPKHLFLGKQLDNVRDMIQKGRHGNTVRYGKNNGMAKVTEETVREIRASYTSKYGSHSQEKLAEKFGLSESQVWAIANYRAWKNVASWEVT